MLRNIQYKVKIKELLFKLILLIHLFQVIICFDESKIIFLVDEAQAESQSSLNQYLDNYHQIPFSQFQLNPTNPSFTLTGKMHVNIETTYFQNFVQIYNTQYPFKKLVMFGFDNTKGSIFVRQQFDINSYQGEILCSYTEVNGSYTQFILSLRKTTKIEIDFTITNGSTTICQSKSTIESNILDWNYNDYTVLFSDGVPAQSPQEYPAFGIVFNVFLIRDTYIGLYANGGPVRTFVKNIVFNSQEGLSLFNKFSTVYGYHRCVPDESVSRFACGYPAQDKFPYVFNKIAKFSKESHLNYLNFYFYFLFNHYLSIQEYITFSFWIYLNDKNTDATLKVFQLQNENRLEVNIQDEINGAGYKIQIVSTAQGGTAKIWNSPQSLNLKKFYFVILSYHKFNSQGMRIIIIDYNGSLSEEMFNSIDTLNLGNRFNLVLGSIDNKSSTFFQLSQFQMNLSSAILYDESPSLVVVNNVIQNCQVAVFIRLKYQCLVCKKGYYLYENTCNDSCITGYMKNDDIRSCIRYCAYKCASCSEINPFECLECISKDRSLKDGCECKKGYEDQFSPECSTIRHQSEQSRQIEFDYISIPQLTQEEITQTFFFSKQFSYIPYVITILNNVENSLSLIKGIKMKVFNLQTGFFQYQVSGSYGGNASQQTNNRIQLVIIPSELRQYYSKTLQFDTPIQNEYYQDIEIGTYDQTKFGDYQILTFLSGIFMGSDTSYSSIQVNFKIEVTNDKKKIKVSVNDYVKMIQVAYFILPASQPAQFQSFTFNINTFFNDPNDQYKYKIHSHNMILTNYQLATKKYLFNSFSSLTALNMKVRLDQFRIGYSYAPQNGLDQQYSRFQVNSAQLTSYSTNGVYLLEEFSEIHSKCINQCFYTSYCHYCNKKYYHAYFECNICTGNRVMKQESCDCPDPDYTKDYFYEYCSYKSIAVLSVNLSVDFSLLTIDFGLPIEPIKFYFSLQHSYELCLHILEQDTLDLISQSASCSISDSLLKITLDKDASIVKGKKVNFKQKLKFIKYTDTIIQFFRNTVEQENLPYFADVDISYSEIVIACSQNIIQVKQFKNDQKRGLSSLEWILVSSDNQNVQDQIQDILNHANLNQSLNLFIKCYFSVDTKVTLSLKYSYKIGISGEKDVNFQVQSNSLLRLHSFQKKNAPFYRKDSFEIFYKINYSTCDQNEKNIQITPTLFKLQYLASDNLQLRNTILSTAERNFSIVIPKYSTQPNIVYKITVICTVDKIGDTFQIDHYLPITFAPLIIYILGGNRQIDYRSELIINATVKDLDLDQNLNLPQNINLTWSCTDLQTFQPCLDIESQLIKIPQGSNSITFPKLTFIPFTSLLFTLLGVKESRQEDSLLIIQFIDSSIPPLEIVLPENIILKKTVSLNELIEAQIVYNQNEDVNKLFFGGAILYNREVQATMWFEYGKVRFQLWDYPINFYQNPKLQIRFLIFNPKYTQPSQSVIQLNLNFPPEKCVLDISPSTGFSLVTTFTISVIKCEDPDQPISYQYFYYSSSSQFDFEKKNPLQIQRKQITDQIFNSAIQTYLPSGELLILVQVIDSKNSIQNITQTITIEQSVQDQQGYVNLVQNLIDYSQKQIQSIQTLTLSLLCEDIIKRQNYHQAVQNQVNQIVSQLQAITGIISRDSTFSTLATQQISQMIKSNIYQIDNIQMKSYHNYVADILDQAEIELQDEQYLKDKSNQQIYNCFTLLDTISGSQQSDQATQKYQITNTKKIGNLLNKDALPNESPKAFKGPNFSITSQVITSKKLPFYLGQDSGQDTWESQINNQVSKDSINQVYDISFQSYNQNIYKNEEEFESFIQGVKKNIPTFSLNEYKTIIPSIQIHGSNQDYVLDSYVKYTFQPIGSENLTCVNQIKGKWTTEGCESVYDKKLKTYNCICDELSSVTVINDIANLFTENKNIETVISNEGIQNILEFDHFYDYAAFWVECLITIMFIILSAFGIFLDKLSASQLQNVHQSRKISCDASPTFQPSQCDVSPTQIHPSLYDDTHQNLQNKDNIEQSQSLSITKSNTQLPIISRFKNMNIQKRKKSLKELDYEFKNKLELVSSEQLKNQPSFLLQKNNNNELVSTEQLKIQPSSVLQKNYQNQSNKEDDSIKLDQKLSFQFSEISINIKKDENTENIESKSSKLNEKDKFNSSGFVKQVVYFHDVFSIFLMYDPNISRFIRLAILYMKNLHIFTFNIIFNKQYSVIQVIFLQVVNIFIATLITKLIELGLSKNIIIRRICQVAIVSLVLFYYYAFLAVISGQEPRSTNTITLYYFITILLDIFGVGLALAIIQRQIALYLFKKNVDITGFQKSLIVEYLKLNLVLLNL